MTDKDLIIFVVYRMPKDYPDKWVVRRWAMDEKGRPVVDTSCITGNSLSEVRCHIPGGLVRFPRSKDEDECIYESWL